MSDILSAIRLWTVEDGVVGPNATLLGRHFSGQSFIDGDHNVYYMSHDGVVYVQEHGNRVYVGDLSEETLDRLNGANARWYENGVLHSYDHPRTIVIHHTELGTNFDTSNFSDIKNVLDDDYDSQLVKLNIIDNSGLERDADCLVVYVTQGDGYADVAAKIRLRLEHLQGEV